VPGIKTLGLDGCVACGCLDYIIGGDEDWDDIGKGDNDTMARNPYPKSIRHWYWYGMLYPPLSTVQIPKNLTDNPVTVAVAVAYARPILIPTIMTPPPQKPTNFESIYLLPPTFPPLPYANPPNKPN